MIKNVVNNTALTIILIATSLYSQNDLNWTQEASKRMNWHDAKKFCKDKTEILPSKKQFKEIWIKNNKSADIKGFDLSVSYWTSTIHKKNSLAAYPFYFGDGKEDWYYKADKYGVRCISNN